MGMMLICDRETMGPENGGMSVKEGKVSISNFRRVLNVVCFLLGDSPASEFYIPMFRNTLSVPTS